MAERNYAAERQQALDRILEDGSQLKLIVAGPGTGKTFTFREALTEHPRENRVLTFIRLLVRDMSPDLESKAEVQTFHAYAVGVLHHIGAPGLSNSFKIFPLLGRLVQREVNILADGQVANADIEERMQWLEPNAEVDAFLLAGDYYDAVAFVDVVFRLYNRLRQSPELIPQHRQLVVDEVQDFTKLEVELIRLLAERSPVLAAGDDDQAIYSRRHASPEFIREMVRGGQWTTFQLPFCSRCTPVIVAAVHDVIHQAEHRGLFRDRLGKAFECYFPDKAADAERYPRIKVAACSVDRPNAHIPARYLAWEIAAIPPEDVAESYAAGYPTVLIIGPGNFTTPIADLLDKEGYDVTRRRDQQNTDIDVLDGYEILMNEEYSRLGWRIVLECDQPEDLTDIVARAVLGGAELRELLSAAYVERHLDIVHLLAKVANGQALNEDEVPRLTAATGRSIDDLREHFGLVEHPPVDVDTSKPNVLVTTFQGAKGLSGGHVFVVGMNEGFLPRRHDITDEDVRLFLVALTRTRKECHLLWVRHYGQPRRGQPPPLLRPSPFLQWIANERLEWMAVNAASFREP